MAEKLKVFALLKGDWTSSPGKRLLGTVRAISDYCQEHMQPITNLEELTNFAWSRAEGEAHEKRAQALKAYQEIESQKIANALAKRTAEDQARAIRATADKLELEAELTKTKLLMARVKLVEEIRRLGVTLVENKSGQITITEAPELLNWDELTAKLLADETLDSRPVIKERPSSEGRGSSASDASQGA